MEEVVKLTEKYYEKCKPWTPGPAAEALIHYARSLWANTDTLLVNYKRIAKGLFAFLLNLDEDPIVVDESKRLIREDPVAAAAVLRTPVKMTTSKDDEGKMAAVIYAVAMLAGATPYKRVHNNLILLDLTNTAGLIVSYNYYSKYTIAIEFCRENVYVWSPVRRYRLKPPISRIINTIAKAARETKKDTW